MFRTVLIIINIFHDICTYFCINHYLSAFIDTFIVHVFLKPQYEMFLPGHQLH